MLKMLTMLLAGVSSLKAWSSLILFPQGTRQSMESVSSTEGHWHKLPRQHCFIFPPRPLKSQSRCAWLSQCGAMHKTDLYQEEPHFAS
ncbi:hypothetical protein B0T17DRAFT_519687 [Bombardia bombarda]|uniref:Secreted protein n=1 Tax=Bombardia bombarda TaxID=252184 RepID=A0AA39XMD0_9PEZI|nr:hypothetical protein B0T17DRAFT_519687 [Bombardia bombarda]